MPRFKQRHDLLQRRLEQFTRMLQGLEKGDVRALHRTRVASRRLRELLPVLQLEANAAAKLSRRLRQVTQRLGSVRELDVLLLIIDGLRKSDRYHPEALNRVAEMVQQELKERRRHLTTKQPVAELHRLGEKLEGVARKLQEREESLKPRRQLDSRRWRWAVDARVARRAARLGRTIDAAGTVYLPDRLHDVRIALKKLRYALEIADEASGSTNRAELRTLKQVQDLLGRLHDLQMLIDHARQAQASLAPPNVMTWRGLQALDDVLEDDCRRLHARYMRERDGLSTLCARLAGRAKPTPARRVIA